MNDEQLHPRLLLERCKELLAERSLGLQADEGWIRARLDAVAAIEARITEPYYRAEAALARGRRALMADLTDIAVAALREARETFSQPAYEREATFRRVGDCSMALAVAHASSYDIEAAVAECRTAQHAYQSWEAAEGIDHWTDTTIYLASQLIRGGRYDEAFSELQAARSNVGHSRSRSTRIELARARILAAQGQYEAADQLVGSLTSDDQLLAAEIAGTRGVILAAAGRLAEATELLIDARDNFAAVVDVAHAAANAAGRGPSDDDLEHLGRLRSSVAVCDTDLGAVYGAVGQHFDALARYQAALSVLDSVPLNAIRVVECRLNVGVESMAIGDLSGAENAFSEVEHFFAGGGSGGHLKAGCVLNTGRLRDMQQRHPDAQRLYRDAREAFLHLGLVEWAARCGLNLASSVWMAEQPGGAVELIPAMLVLDRMRFQFPTASARRAWRDTIAGSNQLAFALADGDPQLIAELIENTINSGVHSAVPVAVGTVGSQVELADRLQVPGEEPARSQSVTARATATPGAGALIAGAILPMHPPPQVRLPNDSLALQHYRELAQATYGPGPWADARIIDSYQPVTSPG